MNELEFNKLVAKEKAGLASPEELASLEPYRIKKAIFFAAGFGSRLVPITLEMPKPLVKVNGVRIIDTLMDTILTLGIEDITVIRGYQKEKMDVLLEKYPMIKFIDNDIYNEANNISSALLAKDMFQRALVLESDLVLYNQDSLEKYAYKTHYLGVKMDHSDDWCFKVNEDLLIESVHIGGDDVYQMVGISYWNEQDGKQLGRDVEAFYNQEGGPARYWDEVSLIDYKDNYNVYVKPLHADDIIEIDTYEELQAIDPSYQ